MATDAPAEINPLIAPFLAAHLDYREVLRSRVEALEDDELAQVLDLFDHRNLGAIPTEFWPVASRVRAFIRREVTFRANRKAAITEVTHA